MTEFDYFCPGCGDPFPTMAELKQHEEDTAAYTDEQISQIYAAARGEVGIGLMLNDGSAIPWTQVTVGWKPKLSRAARMPANRYRYWRN